MSITYDEVWISTIREIKICKDYISIYEKELNELEKNLGVKASELDENLKKNENFKRLYEVQNLLNRERKRLKELEELLK